RSQCVGSTRCAREWTILVQVIRPAWLRNFGLALSPFQFAVQHVEESSFDAQQLHLILRLAAEHAITVVDGHSDLSIDAHVGFFVPGLGDELDFCGVTNYQWAMGE